MTESKLKIFALSLVTLLFSFIIFFHPRTIRENEDRKAINQLTDENLTQKSVIQNEINVFCFIKNENVLQTCTKIASLLSNVSEKKIFVYLVHFSDEKITPQNVDKLNSINSIRDFNLEFVSLE
ncbi:MAG: hypothetical protein LBI55_02040, partial [Oscillospiraceae bacterium]|nr:hypothetical protein [Oscillospiraceae bacterium]